MCFPVWLRNRLISAGKEPVISHTEPKFYCRQFSTNIQMKFKPVLLTMAYVLTGLKTGFNLIIFYFNIRGKLSKIQCDKKFFVLEKK